MPYYIGVDPGLTGAIALLEKGRVLECRDLIVQDNETPGGKVNRRIDAEAMNDLLTDWSHRYEFGRNVVYACLEAAVPLPKMPSTTTASTFDSFGCLRTLLILRMPLTIVHPQRWKRTFGLKAIKDESIEMARRLYPNAGEHVVLKKHHNRAEAILIGHWHYKTHFA